MPSLRTVMLAMSCVLSAHAHAADAACDTVRFSDVGWTDITMTTAAARLIVSELGYGTSVDRLSLPQTYAALAENKVDVFLGNWMPAQQSGIGAYLQNGSIVDLQVNLSGVRYTLATLDTAYQAGLRDFADIAKFRDKLGGKLYGIEPGNKGNEMLKGMIHDNTFGLEGFTVVESSENGMLNAVERAQHLDGWAVFLGWEPHPMNDKLKMQYLSGGDAFFGADYGRADVHTVVRRGFVEQCPNLAKLFRNIRFTVSAENQMMSAMLDGNTNPRREAKSWLEANPQVVDAWLQGVSQRDGRVATNPFSTPVANR